MFVEIVTPGQTLYAGEATLVQLPGSEGSFEVMQNHAPIIALLKAGKVKVKDAENKDLFFEINGGVMENLKNKLIILAE
jgi:F-type H+-transporting ATPase subunit epsilon